MNQVQPHTHGGIPRGRRLRIARESLPGRLTQAQFAQVVGVSRNTVSRYENDEPGTDKPIVLMRWAEVTGYDYDWLTDKTPPGLSTIWYRPAPTLPPVRVNYATDAKEAA